MKQNQSDPRDAALRDALRAALPDAPASSALRVRVAQMAARSEAKSVAPQRVIKTRRARLAWSAMGVACALLAFAVALPRALTTQAMAQIEAAMADVKSAHIKVYVAENGVRVLHDETWYQNGKWRTQDHERGITNLRIGSKSWLYDATSNQVKVSQSDEFPDLAKVFTISALTQNMEMEGQKPDVTLLSDAQLNGRTVGRIRLVSRTKYETSTLIFCFDKATDLPIRGDATARAEDGGELKVTLDFSFNTPLAASLFEPHFPQPDKLESLRRGIGRVSSGPQSIVVRDLQVNPRGDVFVLYTPQQTPHTGGSSNENMADARSWFKVRLSDSLGTRYHLQREPTYTPQQTNAKKSASKLFDGQKLLGEWWIPDEPFDAQQRWMPRTFALRFDFLPKGQRDGQNAKFPANYNVGSTLYLPVSQTTPLLVPSVARTLGIALSDQNVLRAEAQAQAHGEVSNRVAASPALQHVLLENEATYHAQFSPDGRQILLGSEGGARLFDVASGRLIKRWRGAGDDHASQIVFAPDGKTLGAAFATHDYHASQFALWDAATGQQRARWNWDLGDAETLGSLQLSSDNRTLRVLVRQVGRRSPRGGVEQMNVEVQERDPLTGRVRARRTLVLGGFVVAVAQAEMNGRWWIATLEAAVSPSQRLLTRWDGATGNRMFTEDVTMLDGRALAIAAGRVAVGGQVRPLRADGSIDFEAMPGGSEVRTYAIDADKNLDNFSLTGNNFGSAIALSSDGRFIAFEDAGHTISVRDVQSGRVIKTLTGHYAGIGHLAFSPDGKRLVSADYRGKTFAWKLD